MVRLSVKVKDVIGSIAEISSVLGEKGINLLLFYCLLLFYFFYFPQGNQFHFKDTQVFFVIGAFNFNNKDALMKQ